MLVLLDLSAAFVTSGHPESCYRDWDMLLGLEGQHWDGSDRYQFARVHDVAS